VRALLGPDAQAMTEIVVLFAAGVVAGALNAVGGGGTFVALPALVAAGLPAVTANASTTVALLPGVLASVWAYRHDIVPLPATSTGSLTAVSVVGGALGAGLLVVLPGAGFDAVLPWLLAFATVVLAAGRRITVPAMAGRPVLAAQLLLTVYGGYFGGAVGILMLAVWSVDPAVANPLRVTQIGAVYSTAAVVFLFTTDVLDHPGPLLAMLTGAIVGGVAGARAGRRLPGSALRAIIVTVAATMTVLYTVQWFRQR
jgi:uncharacterized protein